MKVKILFIAYLENLRNEQSLRLVCNLVIDQFLTFVIVIFINVWLNVLVVVLILF